MKTPRNSPQIHPGEILIEEFMRPLELSAYRIAQVTALPASRLAEIIAGRRSVTPDTALRLGAALGTTPEFWLNLQATHDLRAVARTNAKDYRSIPSLIPCPA